LVSDRLGVAATFPGTHTPYKATLWERSYHARSDSTLSDLKQLKHCLDAHAAPDLALRSINLKIYYGAYTQWDVEILEREDVRHALSQIHAIERVSLLEICLSVPSWSRKLRFPDASWRRGDPLFLNFAKSAKGPPNKGDQHAHSSIDSDPEEESDNEGGSADGSDESDGGSSDGSHDDGGDDSNDHESDNGDGKDGPGSSGDEHPEDDGEDESDSTDSDDADEDSGSDEDDRISNGDDVVSDAGPEQPASYFDFFGLPPELRDMIYDQPQLFETQTVISNCDLYLTHIAADKPCSSLLLVSKQIGSEYKRTCERRAGLSVVDNIHCFTSDGQDVELPPMAAEEASFMHMHVEGWRLPSDSDGEDTLGMFKDWLQDWTDQTPNLETVTVNLNLYELAIQVPEDHDEMIKKLCGLVSLDLLTEIKVIAMEEDTGQWHSSVNPKKLLLDWKREDDVLPQFIDPVVGYAQTCCSHVFLDLSAGVDQSSYCSDESEENDG
jgi:hypothetical protein